MSELNREFLNSFAELGGGSAGKALSRLIRPAFVAAPGKRLVWGDWSSVEARALPWLAGPSGDVVLDRFRKSDADPHEPDVYMHTACDITGDDAFEMWARYKEGDEAANELRQGQGKVPVLSLGFGGALGALQAMATNYGVYIGDNHGTHIVDTWRERNPWAREFWNALWRAALSAMDRPDTIYTAGRCAYVYDKYYMKGTLFCALPCGRLITYSTIRWRKVEKEDPKTGKVFTKNTLFARKGYGWAGIWYGKLAENNTQGVATGSLLRHKLVKLNRDHSDWAPVIGHTHDEIILEVDDDPAIIARARSVLQKEMETNDDWNEGLPLAAEIEDGAFYTKAKWKG